VLTALCSVAALVAITSWALWPSAPPPARERQYGAATACLLTDEQGLAGEQANAAWAGMQEASLATLIKVQYLSVSGPQTPANAAAYFNSLALQKCALIIAIGEAPISAMVEGHSRFPDPRYVAIGGNTKDAPVTAVQATSPDGIRAATKKLVSEAA
jgi:basic membrane lipoprotein Med (substrate-binding protein (PBP1-ABC) superfamily)